MALVLALQIIQAVLLFAVGICACWQIESRWLTSAKSPSVILWLLLAVRLGMISPDRSGVVRIEKKREEEIGEGLTITRDKLALWTGWTICTESKQQGELHYHISLFPSSKLITALFNLLEEERTSGIQAFLSGLQTLVEIRSSWLIW